MRKIVTLLAAVILANAANALNVSVNNMGDIPVGGLEILVNQGEIDPIMDDLVMSVEGAIQSSADSLTVTISRSEAELEDEFCCGIQCTAGNGETEEQRRFKLSGQDNWFIHYYPAPGSDVTIRYVFDDGTDTRTLTVRYVRASEGISDITSPTVFHAIYTLGGQRLPQTSIDQLPAGMYIIDHHKIYKK